MHEVNNKVSAAEAPQPPLLTDRQVGDIVADKFLTEVRVGMDMSSPAETAIKNRDQARNDLVALFNDPQKSAVVDAIGRKIEAHDPAIGNLAASVERDKSGKITAFVFTNPTEQYAYRESLNNDMRQGMTLKQAQLQEDLKAGADQARVKGEYPLVLQYCVPKDWD